ncbi:MAG: hypothetical protein ACFFG0_37840 [Candidatus Thorarchaeota archaeon]
MVAVQLLGMTYKEMRDWLNIRYPKPREIVINDRYGDYDFTCVVHGWCLPNEWDGCEYLKRCPHGKAQSRIDWPTPERAAAMTPEERIQWQRSNFPKKRVKFEIPDVGTFHCIIYGWCIKEQYIDCIYTDYCPEYWENKQKCQNAKINDSPPAAAQEKNKGTNCDLCNCKETVKHLDESTGRTEIICAGCGSFISFLNL